ncbi:hypothetical protein CC2G_000030 [Coprinopsis cinerea AmutBmut pab1-1]|nr:hypothetical protein CC2G_000030 [Coprinopsis cinerea AmutBmut pab1-1]
MSEHWASHSSRSRPPRRDTIGAQCERLSPAMPIDDSVCPYPCPFPVCPSGYVNATHGPAVYIINAANVNMGTIHGDVHQSTRLVTNDQPLPPQKNLLQ